MKFKTPRQQAEWDLLHPQVQRLVMDLDNWTRAQGMPEVVVTCVARTRAEQEELYWRQEAQKAKCSEVEARRRARGRFSWHLCYCAADLRDAEYTSQQLASILRWLKDGRTQPLWEILDHTVGAGFHLHVARRGFDWRTQHTPKE